MDDLILETIIKWFIPTLLTGVLTFVSLIFKKLLKEFRTIKNDIQTMYAETKKSDLVILWGMLHDITGKCIEKQSCDNATLCCIDDLFARYEQLDGNHGMKLRVAQCKELAKNIKV